MASSTCVTCGAVIDVASENWRLLPAAAASQLKQPGDTSPVVESDDGFHLIKLTDLRPEKNLSLEAVTATLRTRLGRERRDARVAKFTEELQERAHFQTDEAALQKLQVDLQAPQAAS